VPRQSCLQNLEFRSEGLRDGTNVGTKCADSDVPFQDAADGSVTRSNPKLQIPSSNALPTANEGIGSWSWKLFWDFWDLGFGAWDLTRDRDRDRERERERTSSSRISKRSNGAHEGSMVPLARRASGRWGERPAITSDREDPGSFVIAGRSLRRSARRALTIEPPRAAHTRSAPSGPAAGMPAGFVSMPDSGAIRVPVKLPRKIGIHPEPL